MLTILESVLLKLGAKLAAVAGRKDLYYLLSAASQMKLEEIEEALKGSGLVEKELAELIKKEEEGELDYLN